MKTNPRGFTVVELLILVISAVAIPDLIKSRQAARQAAAVASLRTINTSEVVYESTYSSGFSASLKALDGSGALSTSSSAGLIDSGLASGVTVGYNFIYGACPAPPVPIPADTIPPGAFSGPCLSAVPLNVDSYELAANPAGGAGNGNFYYTDQSGVIRMDNSVPASSVDPPLNDSSGDGTGTGVGKSHKP